MFGIFKDDKQAKVNVQPRKYRLNTPGRKPKTKKRVPITPQMCQKKNNKKCNLYYKSIRQSY